MIKKLLKMIGVGWRLIDNNQKHLLHQRMETLWDLYVEEKITLSDYRKGVMRVVDNASNTQSKPAAED